MSAPAKPIRLLLVDDSVLVRHGIRSVLAAAKPRPPIEVVGEAGTVAEAVAAALRLEPDVVLLDIRLPDEPGFKACREITRRLPGARVLILSAFTSDNFIEDAIASGACGYLLKEIDSAGLVRSIHDVAAGKSILSPDVTDGVLRLMRGGGLRSSEGAMVGLSPQQRRVLAAVAEGKTNKEIAAELGLSNNTVKNYLASTFDKLRVKRRSQATAIYLQSQGKSATAG